MAMFEIRSMVNSFAFNTFHMFRLFHSYLSICCVCPSVNTLRSLVSFSQSLSLCVCVWERERVSRSHRKCILIYSVVFDVKRNIGLSSSERWVVNACKLTHLHNGKICNCWLLCSCLRAIRNEYRANVWAKCHTQAALAQQQIRNCRINQLTHLYNQSGLSLFFRFLSLLFSRAYGEWENSSSLLVGLNNDSSTKKPHSASQKPQTLMIWIENS